MCSGAGVAEIVAGRGARVDRRKGLTSRVDSADGGQVRDPGDRGPGGDHHQPGEGVLPEGGVHEAGPGAVLPGGGGGRAARRAGPANGAEAVRERRGRGAVLPETGTREPASGDRNRARHLPERAFGRPVRDRRRGGPGLGGQPGVCGPEPVGGARGRCGSPGRAPDRPGPNARGKLRDGARGRAAVPGGAGGLRLRGVPQDIGQPGHPHQRTDRAAMGVRRCAPGGAGARAGGGAAGAGTGDNGVVEGRAARGVHRLQPECAGPDGGLGLFGAADSECTGLYTAGVGRSGDGGAGGLHGRERPAAVRGTGGPGRGNRRPGLFAGAAAGAEPAAGAGGNGRRALSAALPEGAR